MSQKPTDVGRVEVSWVLPVMEDDVTPNPGDIGVFSATAVVTGLGTSANLVEKSRWL